MNHVVALQTLGLSNQDEVTWKDIKQQYRMYALMYHPDKNKAEDAPAKFLEKKEAYEYLEKNWREEDDILSNPSENTSGNTYQDILRYVLGNILAKNEKVHEILDKILLVCEKQSIQIIEKLEDHKFRILYSILTKYKHIFFLSNEFYLELEDIYLARYSLDIIEVYSTIDDMWNHLVYKLQKDEETYLVPLWHPELVYEHKGKEFMVKCIFRNNTNQDIWIDDNNNIYQQVTYPIQTILEKSEMGEKIEVYYGERKFEFLPEQLKVQPFQTIKWVKQGISKVMEDIQDISHKSDVFLNVHLCI